MRTLEELRTIAREAAKEHASAVAALDKDYSEAVAAREKAKDDQKAAIAAGDQKAHAEAVNAEKFYNDRASVLYGKKAAPHFTNQEHNALVAEINKAVIAEKQPLFEHLWALVDDWNATVKKISNTQSMAHNIGATLLSLVPFEHQNGIGAPRWNNVQGGMNIEDVFSVFGNSNHPAHVLSVLRQYCPKK